MGYNTSVISNPLPNIIKVFPFELKPMFMRIAVLIMTIENFPNTNFICKLSYSANLFGKIGFGWANTVHGKILKG